MTISKALSQRALWEGNRTNKRKNKAGTDMGRKSNAAAKRREIVNALFECLATKGHEKVTIKEIAFQAGVAPGVIHYYFKSKNDIVAGLMEQLSEKYHTIFSERLAQVVGQDNYKAAFADFLCDEFIFNRSVNRVFYNLVQMGFESDVVQKPLQIMMETYRNQAEIYCSGLGSLPSNAGFLAVALIEGLALQWMIDPNNEHREDIRNLVIGAIETDPALL
jgi:AcrR family transcriptional regulator